MALRLSVSGDNPGNTLTGVTAGSDITIMCWARRVGSGGSANETVLAIGDATNNIFFERNVSASLIYTNSTGQTPVATEEDFYETQWKHFAMTWANGGEVAFYLNGLLQNTLQPPSWASVDYYYYVGGNTAWFNGNIAGLKVWGATLGADQVLAESFFIRPLRKTNLLSWCPCIELSSYDNGRRDWSGNGESFSSAETGVTMEAEAPPAPWGAPVITMGNGIESVWYDHEGTAPWSSVWRSGRV